MAGSSTISAGTTIRGRIQAESDLEVQGHIEGNVESAGNVTIAAGATLKSNVTGRELSVAGAVKGDLRGSELLVLEEGARVVGDVSAPTIGIRPGALIRGRVETSDTPSAKGPSRAASRATTRTEERTAPTPVMPKAGRAAQKKTAKKTTSRKSSAKKSSARRTTAAKKKATKKTASKRAKKAAPKPAMPALKKRTKKAAKRKSR